MSSTPIDWSMSVYGRPVPQGSLRSFITKKGGIVTPQSNPVQVFRGDIRTVWGEPSPTASPVRLMVSFQFKRPASHYLPVTKGRPTRVLRDTAPTLMGSRPDIDKLARCVMDALTGYAYDDDSQVAILNVAKGWGEVDVTHITISEVKQ